jgi:subfamily B ATP-binding cassette protein MsbA
MDKIKEILRKNFKSLSFFYRYLRYRLVILLITTILVGVLDSLGIAMFLPLLEFISNEGTTESSSSLGNLSFIIDGIEALGFEMTLTVVLITMLIFFTLKGLAKYIESYLKVVYQQYFISRIRVENINAFTRYSYSEFVSANAGEIQNTLSGEVQRVIMSFTTYSQMLQQLVLVVTYSFLAFMANAQFAILVVIGGVLSNFLYSVLYSRTKSLSYELVSRNHDFQGMLIQEVAFFKYLKATGKISQYAKNLKDKVYDIENTTKNIGILRSIMGGSREPLMIFIVVAVILIQINLLDGKLGSIIFSLLLFYRGLSAVTLLQSSYNKFLGFSGSLVNIQQFILDLKRHQEPNGKAKFDCFKKDITLNKVSYHFNQGENVLNNIDLTIHKNETIAFVGESGSGKSTLLNIISGLLKPKSGTLLIDGIDAKNLNISYYQKRIGYITQEPVVFDDSVFNNVTFWDSKTEENLNKFWKVLQQSNIKTLVEELKDGLDTRLGNNGVSLSGGQKQRISIARELYKDVDFLFMDEATSALDSETERQIQSNIDLLKGKYTIVIIAHRLSTIKNADRVVMMNKGRIEKVGSYKELIKTSKTFSKMVGLQEV